MNDRTIGERLVNDRGRLEDNIERYKVGRDLIEGDWGLGRIEGLRVED